MVKGKVTFNSVLITLNTEKTKSNIILVNDTNIKGKEGKLFPYQTIVSAGGMCQEVKVGDTVIVDFDAFLKPVRNTKNNMDAQVPETSYELQIPLMEINGEVYGHISERNIKYVYDESEIPKEVKA
jgi:hypothetical protein